MTTRCLPLAAALTLAVSIFDAAAQPASAPVLPGDLRPENPVTPQLSIPLGKKPVLAPEPRAQRRIGSASAVAGGIDDASARCEAQASDAARAACRGKLAQTDPRR